MVHTRTMTDLPVADAEREHFRPQVKVRLSDGVYARLKRLARRDGRTITWHIAAAVAAYLKENGA